MKVWEQKAVETLAYGSCSTHQEYRTFTSDSLKAQTQINKLNTQNRKAKRKTNKQAKLRKIK